jgi:DNA-binding HxlR family transcriptional regulator
MRKEKFCPLTAATEILSKKWSLVVIAQLLSGEKRFSEIEKSIPEISPKVLSSCLGALERHGLVVREVEVSSPIKVKYRLTEKGKEMARVVEEVRRWAEKWER